jgi:hypothetical protein
MATGGTEGASADESAIDQLTRRLRTALDQRSYVEEVLRTTEHKLVDHQERLEAAAAAQRQAEDAHRTQTGHWREPGPSPGRHSRDWGARFGREHVLGQRTEQLAGVEKALQQTVRELATVRMAYSTEVERLKYEADADRQALRTVKVCVGPPDFVPCG